MPTHFHATVTALDDDLSAIMRDMKKHTSRATFDLAAQDGNKLLTYIFEKAAEYDPRSRFKVWQDEFHPKVIRSEQVFLQKADYVHLNPVRKGLCVDPTHWYYSSAAAYADRPDVPIDIDRLDW